MKNRAFCRFIIAFFLGIVLLLVTPSVSLAADCQFVLGFKTLRDLIGHDIVGECLENEHYNAIGDSVQQTTGGLLAWRKADNWTAFTDGYRTWVNGPNGIQQRLNTERFEWEADYGPGGGIATPTPSPNLMLTPLPRPPISDSKLAHAAEVMRTTPSGETAYQILSQYQVDVVFGRNYTWGQVLFEPANNRIVVYGKFHLDPPEVLAAFIARGTALAKWFYEQGEPTTLEQCIDREYLAISALDAWNLEKLGNRGKFSSLGNTDEQRYERARRNVTYRIGQPLDYELNDPILCPAVPRISVDSEPTPTAIPDIIPVEQYVEGSRSLFGPEEWVHEYLRGRGLNHGSTMYAMLRDVFRPASNTLGSLYLAYLDSQGRYATEDKQDFRDFFSEYFGNVSFRRDVARAVRAYLENTEYLGPNLTAVLRSDQFSLQYRVNAIGNVAEAMLRATSPRWLADSTSVSRRGRIENRLRESFREKTYAWLYSSPIPNPWYEH